MDKDERAIAKVEVIARPLPMVALTSVGMLLDRPLTYDEWATGLGIGMGNRAYSWAAGDWLVYGEREFPDRYSQAMETTGLSLGYLRNLASLCSKIPRHLRNPRLSITHHQAVASFNHHYQKLLLDMAEKNEWDRDTFRSVIAEIKANTEADPNVVVITPKKSKDAIVDQAKHVVLAWRDNYGYGQSGSREVSMTLHEALEQLAEMIGE